MADRVDIPDAVRARDRLPAQLLERAQQFYIGGTWVSPLSGRSALLIDPATEQPIAELTLGGMEDVERAIAAARKAFKSYAALSIGERIELLRSIAQVYDRRREELAQALTAEMGAPLTRTRAYQTAVALTHIEEMVRVLEHYPFELRRGRTLIVREPVGVCALITPWNAPLMQIASKVAPALGAGCTMVLKPSEQAPLSAALFAEVLHDAGVPPGVFNLVHGDGRTVGEALAGHPDIDMVSFTGSTRAGVRVAELAAASVKRVHQELGGKSANILLDDVDLESAVSLGVRGCYANSGQSCIAPDRMLIPGELYERAVALAARTAGAMVVGDPWQEDTMLGPLVNARQLERVQAYIRRGLDEGARLVAGGTGRPPQCRRGYYARPTVFADVTPEMAIAREEIFGPVLLLMRYADVDEAIRIANDTPYGLAAYVQSPDAARAEAVARALRVGYVYCNYGAPDYSAPFGGYKRSGNGREYGEWGLEAFLELKTIVRPE